MCDYDGGEPTRVSIIKLVLTRVPHMCRQCRDIFARGTKMNRWSCVWGGTASTVYLCQTCLWMSEQPESSPFHICLDTGGGDNVRSTDPRYQAVKIALEKGEVPDLSAFPAPSHQDSYAF